MIVPGASLARTPSVRRAAQYIEYGQATNAQAAAASGVRSSGGRLRRPEGHRPGTIKARSRGRRRCEPSGRRLRRLLGPGCSAAPGRHCLALLPSGPDAVRRLPMRGTWLSTLRAPAQTPDDSAPQAVLGPAIADCGFREPLAPRLARPGRTMVAHCGTLTPPGRVAQRESARLTRERSLVRSQPRPFFPRPLRFPLGGAAFGRVSRRCVCEPRPHMSAAASGCRSHSIPRRFAFRSWVRPSWPQSERSQMNASPPRSPRTASSARHPLRSAHGWVFERRSVVVHDVLVEGPLRHVGQSSGACPLSA